MGHLVEGGPRPAEEVGGGKGDLIGPPHEEAPEDAAEPVALLVLFGRMTMRVSSRVYMSGGDPFL